jgi:hypothetical protein
VVFPRLQLKTQRKLSEEGFGISESNVQIVGEGKGRVSDDGKRLQRPEWVEKGLDVHHRDLKAITPSMKMPPTPEGSGIAPIGFGCQTASSPRQQDRTSYYREFPYMI